MPPNPFIYQLLQRFGITPRTRGGSRTMRMQNVVAPEHTAVNVRPPVATPERTGPARRWQMGPNIEALEITPEEQARREEMYQSEVWRQMRSGEAYQPGQSPDFEKNLLHGLLTGDYRDVGSLAVGMGIESTPIVGDLLFGGRDVALGMAEGSLGRTYAGALGALPFIPSLRGVLKRAEALNVPRHLAPEATGSARALALAESFRPVEIRGTGAVPAVRTMHYDDAVDFARQGGHLRVGSEGRVIGAPQHVTLQNINEMRNELDFHAARGWMGMDWYQRARGSVAEIAGSSAERQRVTAGTLGAYSPQANPRENLRRTLLSESGTSATGEVPQVNTAQQQRVVREIREGAQAEDVLGPKTSPFASKIRPGESIPQPFGVNDIWHARAFGYETQGGQFKRGLGEAQHNFMDAETVLAAERANATRLGGRTDWSPEELQAAIWVSNKGESLATKAAARRLGVKAADVRPQMITPEDMQQGLQEAATEFREHFPEFTTYMQSEAVPGGATGHLPRLQRSGQYDFDVETHEGGVFSLSRETEHGDALMSLHPEGKTDFKVQWVNLPIEQHGRGLGSQMYLEAAREAERRGGKLWSDSKATSPQAKAVWNRFVDAGIAKKSGDRWYMRPSSDWPDEREIARQFSMDPRSSGLTAEGRDILLEDVGMLQRPALPAQGVWYEGGRLFTNPAEATRAMTGKTSVELGQVLDDNSLAVMDKVAATRAFIDAQNAAAYHSISPVLSATKSESINAVRITGGTGYASPDVARRLNDAVEPYGFAAVHTGDGWSLLPVGENKFGAPLTGNMLTRALEGSAQQGMFGQHLGEQIRQILGDVDIQRGVWGEKSGNYIDFTEQWKQGKGAATKAYLDIFYGPDAPAAAKALEEGKGIRELASRRHARDAEWGQRLGGTRDDIQHAREILAEGGPSALRKALESGDLNLPILAAAVLGAGAARRFTGSQGQQDIHDILTPNR